MADLRIVGKADVAPLQMPSEAIPVFVGLLLKFMAETKEDSAQERRAG